MIDFVKIAFAFTLASSFFCQSLGELCNYSHFESLYVEADKGKFAAPKGPETAPGANDDSYQPFVRGISCISGDEGEIKYVFDRRDSRFYDEIPVNCFRQIFDNGTSSTFMDIKNLFLYIEDNQDVSSEVKHIYSCVPTMDITELKRNLKKGTTVESIEGVIWYNWQQNSDFIYSKNRIACDDKLVYEVYCQEPDALVRFRCREATADEKAETENIEMVFQQESESTKFEVCGLHGTYKIEVPSGGDGTTFVGEAGGIATGAGGGGSTGSGAATRIDAVWCLLSLII